MVLTLTEFCQVVQLVLAVKSLSPGDLLRRKIAAYIDANYPDVAALLAAGEVILDPVITDSVQGVT
jgi:hypothetical protein